MNKILEPGLIALAEATDRGLHSPLTIGSKKLLPENIGGLATPPVFSAREGQSGAPEWLNPAKVAN
jgi:hypothetical protein